MAKRMTATILLVALWNMPVWAQRSSTSAPEPDQIAKRCSIRMKHIAGHTSRRMHGITNHCVRVITVLLANGHDQQADAVAQRCSRVIDRQSARGVRYVGATADRCVTALEELDAPDELIAAVRDAAMQAVMVIQTHRDQNLQRIMDALSGG